MFHATRQGHICNARELLKQEGFSVEDMPDETVEHFISERYVAVVLQEDASDYDEIYLVVKSVWEGVHVINR
jgi:hypothetical protein